MSQKGKDIIAGRRKKRLKGTKRFTDVSDRELNIGPVTPIGRGMQRLDPSAHSTARGITYAAATIPLAVAAPVLRTASALTKARNKASAAQKKFAKTYKKLKSRPLSDKIILPWGSNVDTMAFGDKARKKRVYSNESTKKLKIGPFKNF